MSGFNFLDWLVLGFLALWLIIIIMGFVRGLIRQVGGLAGLVVGFLAANWWSKDLAQILREGVGSFEYWSVVAFGVLFLLGFIACVTTAWILSRLLARIDLRRWDRLSGGLFAVVKGFVLGLVLVFVFTLFFSSEHSLVRNSKLAPHVRSVVVRVYDLLPATWAQSITTTHRQIAGAFGRTDAVGKVYKRGGGIKNVVDAFGKMFRSIFKGSSGSDSSGSNDAGAPPPTKPSSSSGASGTYTWSPNN
ncbi:MAG: CvpA family protein [Proteobacteria bacterium]|nr:CvpA family protein [Pseudomonadota bacterium]MBU1740490.1 CvpA family protein [Pseudomonadota bacterium]